MKTYTMDTFFTADSNFMVTDCKDRPLSTIRRPID